MKSFTFTNKIQCTQEKRNVFPSSGVWIIFTPRLQPHQSVFSPRKADIKVKSIRYPLSALLWTICNWGQHWQIDPLPHLPPNPGYLLSYIQPPTGGQPLHRALTSTWGYWNFSRDNIQFNINIHNYAACSIALELSIECWENVRFLDKQTVEMLSFLYPCDKSLKDTICGPYSNLASLWPYYAGT